MSKLTIFNFITRKEERMITVERSFNASLDAVWSAWTEAKVLCKWWAPKLACEIIHQCLLTHGHGGYASDYDFGQRYRDVMGLQIGDGTANIMKMIIGREKLAADEI